MRPLPSPARACGWCKSVQDGAQHNCTACGGPLPLPPAPDPGPPPPPAPRALPGRFVRQHVYGGFGVAWGTIFGGVGGLLAFIFLVIAFVFPPMLLGVLIGGTFFLVGATVAGISIYRGRAAIQPLREGRAAVAEVLRVRELPDPAQGRAPFLVDYTFSTPDGATWGGSITTSDPRMALVQPGHHLHVVYLPRDPSQNAPWPPMQTNLL